MRARPDKPRVRLGAGLTVMSPDGRLLLVQQEYDRERTWGMIGGSMEAGETIEACAVREAHEEAGLHVRLLRLTEVTQFWRGDHFESVGFVFLATPEPWPQTVRLPPFDGDTRLLDYRWFSKEEAAAIPASEREQQELLYSRWPSEVEQTVMRTLRVGPDEPL